MFSLAASSSAERSGRMLKPMMTAFEASARVTSLSVMAPTPARMILIFTFSVESFCKVSVRTSAEPCTSALTIIGRSLTLPSWTCWCRWSRVRRADDANSRSRSFCWRNSEICRALKLSPKTWN